MGRRSFDIAGVLGEGGFGRVYEAVERDGDDPARLVAIKVLREDPPPADVLARFRAEAALLRRIGDRAFVRAEPPMRLGGRWAVVLEHVEGIPLEGLVDQVPPRAALEIVAECARALRSAHGRRGPDGRALGLVHRDLTPANLLVTATGEVRITDLGLGRDGLDRGARTVPGLVAGTPSYVAPERFRGEGGPPVDVFSLGVALARMCPPEAPDRTAPAVTAPSARVEARALAERMRSEDPADRPSMLEVQQRAQAIAAAIGGPGLGDWAQAVVPARAPLRTDNPWTGRCLEVDGAQAPRTRAPLAGLLALALAVAALPSSTARQVVPAEPEAVAPAPEAAPAPPLSPVLPVPSAPPVPVWVRTRPWGRVTVGGRRWDTEDPGMRLLPGPHVLELASYDGRYTHSWPIEVAERGENKFCWNFERAVPCSP